jgi:hypothetical protein
MATRRKPVAPKNGKPARKRTKAARPRESLGDQLIRDAREGHDEIVKGWREFMNELGIHGKPIGARQLREMLIRNGINPNDNEFSRAIIAAREE